MLRGTTQLARVSPLATRSFDNGNSRRRLPGNAPFGPELGGDIQSRPASRALTIPARYTRRCHAYSSSSTLRFSSRNARSR